MTTIFNIFTAPALAAYLAFSAYGTWWHAALFFVVVWSVTGSANSIEEKLKRLGGG